MISYRFLNVFGDSPPRRQGEFDDLELKFYLSMGSESYDFLQVLKIFGDFFSTQASSTQ